MSLAPISVGYTRHTYTLEQFKAVARYMKSNPSRPITIAAEMASSMPDTFPGWDYAYAAEVAEALYLHQRGERTHYSEVFDKCDFTTD